MSGPGRFVGILVFALLALAALGAAPPDVVRAPHMAAGGEHADPAPSPSSGDGTFAPESSQAPTAFRGASRGVATVLEPMLLGLLDASPIRLRPATHASGAGAPRAPPA